MERPQKLGLALLIALGLHAALILYSFAPKLEGLTPALGGEEGVQELPAAEGSPEASAAAEPGETASGEAIEIDWPVPDAAEPAEPEPAAAEPRKPPAAPKTPAAARPESTAPAVRTAAGSGPSGPVVSADASYANRVRQHLARYAGALPPGASGEARVQFVVQPDGRVSNVQLVKFSGHAGLDAVALSLPTSAQPLPLPGPIAQRLEVPVQAIAATP